MITQQIDTIRQQLADYIVTMNQSQRNTAKQLGVSETLLSLFLNGTYTGNNAEIAEKAQQLIQRGTARKEVIQTPDICLEVSNTVAILRNVKIAHTLNEIALIYGPAGCGKTTALKHYAASNNGVILIEADATTSTPRSVLQMILDEIGEPLTGTTATMMRRIVNKLRDTNRLVIIDEAQHLTEKTFDAVRAINDKAHIGLVYAGNPSILQRMYGRQQDEFDQVYSRVVYKCQLNNSFTQADIAEMYKDRIHEKSCLQYLLAVARRKGGLRIMTKQCKIAQNIAASMNEPFTVQHLNDAAEMMGIGGQAS